jgi:hypothetical protein
MSCLSDYDKRSIIAECVSQDNDRYFDGLTSRFPEFRDHETLELAARRSSPKIFEYLWWSLQSEGYYIDKYLIFKLACKAGCLEIVDFVASLVDIKNQIGLLRSCVKRRHFDVVKYLIENGCDPKKTDGVNLYKVALRGPLHILIYLERSGYNLSADNINLLHLSAAWGNLEFVKYLFDVGYDVPLRVMSDTTMASEYLFYRVSNRYKIAYLTKRKSTKRHKNITSFRILIEAQASIKIMYFDESGAFSEIQKNPLQLTSKELHIEIIIETDFVVYPINLFLEINYSQK